MSDGSGSAGAVPPTRRWHDRPFGRATPAISGLLCLGVSYLFAYQTMSPSNQGPAWDGLGLFATIAMFVVGYEEIMDARFGRERRRQT